MNDTSDPTLWSHPELAMVNYPYPKDCFYAKVYGGSYTDKEIAKMYEESDFSAWCGYDTQEGVEIKEYTVPGCPEEPGSPTKVLVYSPVNKTEEKYPVLFYCMGGGLMTALPEMFPIRGMCIKYNCVVICPVFRTSWRAAYPGALNDCHAAYQWMMKNGELLQIDTERVVIHGSSSGGHLATVLPFRIMRYSYSPRGVVAVVPIVDDRGSHEDGFVFNGNWDSAFLQNAYMHYLGERYGAPELGPEAFANRATVDDCIGYPPLFVHTGEHDASRDDTKEFVGKVLHAHSWAEYHIWGGAYHTIGGMPVPAAERAQAVIDGNILDCFKYDLRRPFVYETSK